MEEFLNQLKEDFDDVSYEFETISIKLSNLNVPHPQLFARKFVLVPWSEINPDFVVQDFGQSISTLLKVCPDTSKVNIHTMEKSA